MANRKLSILAIDDNPDNLISVKALITEAFPDAVVWTALTGQEGLKIAVSEDPDVILLDIVMPGMDGFELCRKLKADAKLCDTPVVFVTAIKGDRQSRILALECGAEAFLAKPIDETELTAQIRAMVKIKTANIEKRDEKQQLASLVEARTHALREAHVKTVNLVKALKEENEIRRRSESALLEARDYFELVFNTSPDAAVITRLSDGLIINVNEGFVNIAGYSKEEAVGKNRLWFKVFKNSADRKKLVRKLMENGSCSGEEIELLRKDGSPFMGLVSAKVIMLNGIAHMSSNIHDITKRKMMEDNLLYLSYHDYLTGLYNRRYFEQELKRIDTRSMLPISIIVGDFNGLKLINDAFGHLSGDKLIADTAKTILNCCRDSDILARTGGDEFTLLMPKTNSDAADNILKAIQSACEKYNSAVPDEAFRINVALGFATKDAIDQPLDMVMKIAEKYMYQRKLLEHKSIHSGVIASIKATLFEKNEETEEHCERLVTLSRMIGATLNLSQKEMDELELLSTLHDLGKVGIAEQILNKPGEPDIDEWFEIKKHPQIGYRIANASPELAPIAEYILCHHERWDGAGYPQGLSGEQIPLLSRIIAVVDAYDAMTQDRPYRKKMTVNAAIDEIKGNAGKQFDPVIAKIFVDNISILEL